MAKDGETFEQWLDNGKIPQRRRSAETLAILKAAFAFLQHAGDDYASRRILGHFLLNCQLDLKLAQVARLVGVTRPTASIQNKLSSREVVRQVQHRLSGRPFGKLLPRYAGPIAQFLVTHSDATRDDLLDFIEATFNVRVSHPALHNFLKKYGLDRKSLEEADGTESPNPCTDEDELLKVLEDPPMSGMPVVCPSDDFFLATPNMPAGSCCSRKS